MRCRIFGIDPVSPFTCKSIAGNIIPAIATSNAIIAASIVVELQKIVQGRFEDCRQVYLNGKLGLTGKMLVPNRLVSFCMYGGFCDVFFISFFFASRLDPPKPGCYSCSSKPEAVVYLDMEETTLLQLRDGLLKAHFAMMAPDVETDGTSTILLSRWFCLTHRQ